mmetsp:Transcript_37254/g.42538  ORF Transcript_37254/g.42538 Transcript_37254/m.42538 type:complete len:195 (-) Transcript_37254:78-662(-)
MKSQKRVSFININNKPISKILSIPNCCDFNDVERKKQWFVSNDFKMFKITIQEIINIAQQSRYSRLLNGSFDPVKNKIWNADQLILWCRHAHMQRGLEQMINLEHGNHRYQKKKQVIHSVLKAQSLLKLTFEFNTGLIEEQLSRISTLHSHDATIFAQRMGYADATAMITLRNQNFRCQHMVTRRMNNKKISII